MGDTLVLGYTCTCACTGTETGSYTISCLCGSSIGQAATHFCVGATDSYIHLFWELPGATHLCTREETSVCSRYEHDVVLMESSIRASTT